MNISVLAQQSELTNGNGGDEKQSHFLINEGVSAYVIIYLRIQSITRKIRKEKLSHLISGTNTKCI